MSQEYGLLTEKDNEKARQGKNTLYIYKQRKKSDVRNRCSRGCEAMAEKDGVVGERPTLHVK